MQTDARRLHSEVPGAAEQAGPWEVREILGGWVENPRAVLKRDPVIPPRGTKEVWSHSGKSLDPENGQENDVKTQCLHTAEGAQQDPALDHLKPYRPALLPPQGPDPVVPSPAQLRPGIHLPGSVTRAPTRVPSSESSSHHRGPSGRVSRPITLRYFPPHT